MPVRIYDISKKLGIESKQVLAKAKELGITQARLPSSQLDKITAEYLEQQLGPNPPPPVPMAPQSQSQPPGQPCPQPAKAPGITIQTISPDIHDLVERVLSGEIPFVLE